MTRLEKQETIAHLDLLRSETFAERKTRPGFKHGLKHLVSTNFKDFDSKAKPAFGMPIVLYTEDEICQPGDSDDQVKARTNELWSKVITNLFEPLTDEEPRPFLLKAWEERQEILKRW